MKRFLFNLLFILLTLSLSSCSVRKMAINEMTRMAGGGITAFEQDDDLNLVVQALPANIKLFEVLLENHPQNPELLTLLARMYASYGFAFYETRLEALQLKVEKIDSDVDYFSHADIKHTTDVLEKYYQKGAAYALRSLEIRHRGCEKFLANVTDMEDFLKTLSKEDVPALFWYGFNLGGYVNLNRDSVQAMAKIPVVENIMLRVVELDPVYFNAGAHLYLSAFYGSRSPMMGGNLDAAKQHYEAVKQITGREYLLADTFYARSYLYQKQDREEFEKVLTGVIAAGFSKEYALFNQVAADRAKIYLKAMDDMFP